MNDEQTAERLAELEEALERACDHTLLEVFNIAYQKGYADATRDHEGATI